MLAFNFASRTFAYQRLAQSLSRSVSAFLSFIPEYLDPVVKAEQCAQYVEDNGIATNIATDLTRNNRAVFQCIPQAELGLTTEKSHFGARQVELLGRTISPERISPPARKFHNFLNKNRYPKPKNITALPGICKLLQKLYPRMAGKLGLFYNLLKAEVPINTTSKLNDTFDSVKKEL